jgi:phosphate starvation-inducible PhoH-like protein
MQNTHDTYIVFQESGSPCHDVFFPKLLKRSVILNKTRKSAKASPRANVSHFQDDHKNNVVKLNNRHYKKVEMIPRNTAQESYIEQLNDETKRIVIASGSAGTGKSYLATLAAIKALNTTSISKIIITRPMVEVENEKIGFLPGDITAKLDPWVKPIFDIFEEFYSKQEISNMVDSGMIEICPLAFMRGRTLKNSFIILDESQNCTVNQMLMVLTRIGENSRIVVTGDTRQTDRKGDNNGLIDLIKKIKLNKVNGICYTVFDKSHVERDKIVEDVLNLYGEI